LHEGLKATDAEMNEARLRMTRIPKGADSPAAVPATNLGVATNLGLTQSK
jgi:hypothetical protein